MMEAVLLLVLTDVMETMIVLMAQMKNNCSPYSTHEEPSSNQRPSISQRPYTNQRPLTSQM